MRTRPAHGCGPFFLLVLLFGPHATRDAILTHKRMAWLYRVTTFGLWISDSGSPNLTQCFPWQGGRIDHRTMRFRCIARLMRVDTGNGSQNGCWCLRIPGCFGMGVDRESPVGIYFGTTSGSLYHSANEGGAWQIRSDGGFVDSFGACSRGVDFARRIGWIVGVRSDD